MNVVDTLPLFRKHFETTGERANFSPTDWLWNETGHNIAAATITISWFPRKRVTKLRCNVND